MLVRCSVRGTSFSAIRVVIYRKRKRGTSCRLCLWFWYSGVLRSLPTLLSAFRMKIKKLPNVLALHLKRFKYQEDVGKYIKLAYRVAFPFELRLFNTVDDSEDPDRLYELFAVVVHIGK